MTTKAPVDYNKIGNVHRRACICGRHDCPEALRRWHEVVLRFVKYSPYVGYQYIAEDSTKKNTPKAKLDKEHRRMCFEHLSVKDTTGNKAYIANHHFCLELLYEKKRKKANDNWEIKKLISKSEHELTKVTGTKTLYNNGQDTEQYAYCVPSNDWKEMIECLTDLESKEDFVDKAVEFGFEAGDRLEVDWEVDVGGKKINHQWAATLKEHDGKVEEGFAVRVLEYDPFLPSFPERQEEEAVFITNYLLITPNGEELNFRRLGAEEVVDFQEEDLNEMLTDVMGKNSDEWDKLEPAEQSRMANVIAMGKERLMDAINRRWQEQPGKAITAEEVPEIMQQAFQGM